MNITSIRTNAILNDTVITFINSCKYIRLGDGVAIFRSWHGKKNCTGRILVKLPKPWIQGSQGSHKFNLDEVNLTMKPNVIEKGKFVFPFRSLSMISYSFLSMHRKSSTGQAKRTTKKEKTGAQK